MANDPKSDLIYAILTMDSYNRGYGSGISDLNDSGPTARIGAYTIDSHTDDRQNAAINPSFAAGFYAIAYKNGDDIVISYRGTDAPLFSSETKGGSDPLNGYGIALGLTDVPQALPAAKFYEAVAASSTGGGISTRPRPTISSYQAAATPDIPAGNSPCAEGRASR
jgi:hypothetical protein